MSSMAPGSRRNSIKQFDVQADLNRESIGKGVSEDVSIVFCMRRFVPADGENSAFCPKGNRKIISICSFIAPSLFGPWFQPSGGAAHDLLGVITLWIAWKRCFSDVGLEGALQLS